MADEPNFPPTVAVRKSALFMMPVGFYGFAKVIAEGLQRRGYDVTIANDEYPKNVVGKVLGKLRIQWPLSVMTRRVIDKRYLAGQRYDLAFIIKGRGVSRALLQRIRAVCPRIVAYNFDSFAYHPAPLAWYRDADWFGTFDSNDAEAHGVPLVDLFSSLPAINEPKAIRYDLSAILRNHSNRLRYLDAVMTSIRPRDVFVYIFEKDIFTCLVNAFSSPYFYFKYRHYIHFKALPYGDYVAALKASDFTVDYAHPRQTGTTIRCFEALSVQTKIVTNNPRVLRNVAFGDANTIVYTGGDGESLRRRYLALRRVIPAAYVRTVDDFLGDILT